MTTEERQAVGLAWADVAELIGSKITRQQISRMIDQIEHLDPAKVVAFLGRWLATSKARQLPLPIDVLEALGDKRSPRTEAVEAAGRVIESVKKFGWQQSQKAREYIGELGWKGVERLGGWPYLCENLGTSKLPVTMMQAQLRDSCEAMITRGEAGISEAPALPAPILKSSLLEEAAKRFDGVNPFEKMLENKTSGKGELVQIPRINKPEPDGGSNGSNE